jgi:hypothetical protein
MPWRIESDAWAEFLTKGTLNFSKWVGDGPEQHQIQGANPQAVVLMFPPNPRIEEALDEDWDKFALVLARMACCRLDAELLLEPVSKVVKLLSGEVALAALEALEVLKALAPWA